MIGWLRRLMGRPDVARIEARYRKHDRNVVFIRETRTLVRGWRDALAGDGRATGNPISDRARGIYPPGDTPHEPDAGGT